jgi:hypothetical protein
MVPDRYAASSGMIVFSNEKLAAMPYIVFVDDNFHYMDESERYKLGEFADCASAVAACKRIVDVYLDGCDSNLNADEMFSHYKAFGEDPWISGSDKSCRFSAWTYARERCSQLASPANTSPSLAAPKIVRVTTAPKRTIWTRIWAILTKKHYRTW